MSVVGYSEEHIKTLEWREHIRLRPGMYIGKLGDGSSQDDGIYVLLKEVRGKGGKCIIIKFCYQICS
jgi:topoisomerase-4 subunit B